MHWLDSLIGWGFVCASMFYLQFITIIYGISTLLTTAYSSKDVPEQWNADCVRVFTLVQCLLGWVWQSFFKKHYRKDFVLFSSAKTESTFKGMMHKQYIFSLHAVSCIFSIVCVASHANEMADLSHQCRQEPLHLFLLLNPSPFYFPDTIQFSKIVICLKFILNHLIVLIDKSSCGGVREKGREGERKVGGERWQIDR